MRQGENHHDLNNGIIRDVIIILLIFILFSFIDITLASLFSIISTAILLIRRIIFSLNPGFIKGHKIFYEGKEVSVPKSVDVFDLRYPSLMEKLYQYIEVIRSISVPPRILIIRFNGIFQMEKAEFHILNEVINQLSKSKIKIILSDVVTGLEDQLIQKGIAQRIGKKNIFSNISDTMIHAKEVLKIINPSL